jgi:hypothetical protein
VNSKVSDRFKPFIPGMDDLFLEVLGADCTQRTGQQLSGDEMNFLIPLIFYADKTGTDVNQRYSLEPWLLPWHSFVGTSEKTQTLGDTLVSSQISIHKPQRDVGPRENGSLSSLPD